MSSSSSASVVDNELVAASALFNLRSSPVLLSSHDLHTRISSMPFLSLSPTSITQDTPHQQQQQQSLNIISNNNNNSRRPRSNTWHVASSAHYVDTDVHAAGTLCALMQSESPLLSSSRTPLHFAAPPPPPQQQQQQQQQQLKRPRSMSYGHNVHQQMQQQQERQLRKGLRPRSGSMDARLALLQQQQQHRHTHNSSNNNSRRRSRGNSFESLLLGHGGNNGEDSELELDDLDDLDDDLDEEDEDDDLHDVDSSCYTRVSLEIVGQYSPLSRQRKIARFVLKRDKRVWKKEIKYKVRKNFADSRLRVKGRFVRKEDEDQLRDLLNMT